MLSVITIVRNRNRPLQLLLAGLDRQPDLSIFEVVVVDAGGTERPDCVVRRFPDLDVTIQPMQSKAESMFPYAKARNVGAAAARGEVLLFLDADTIPAVGTIKAFANALSPKEAILTGEVCYLPPLPPNDVYPSSDHALRELARPHPARPEPPVTGVAFGADPNLMWSVTLAMLKSTFERVGRFDTGYRGYGAEDTDLTWAAHCQGVPAGLVGGATVFHQHHESHEPPLPHAEALIGNAEYFYRKWKRWPMQGWLAQMASMGLIEWHAGSETIVTRRNPTQVEILASHCDRAEPFRSDRLC